MVTLGASGREVTVSAGDYEARIVTASRIEDTTWSSRTAWTSYPRDTSGRS